MFRRRTTDDDDSVAAQIATAADRTGGSHAVDPGAAQQEAAKRAAAATTGKGRPTPKRSEAEANRAARLNPPKDRREALKQQRERAKKDRAASKAGMLTGDDKFLTARDRGPVRRFVRDYIDSRRTIGEYFLVLGLVIALMSFVGNETVITWAFSAWFALIVLIIGEGFWISSRLRSELSKRFPEEKGPYEGRKGAVFYGIMRAFQLRLLRLPKPQVKPGAKV